MPSKSVKQQQFFGLVDAMQNGELPSVGKAGDVAGKMKHKSVKEFASTKHKGLPKKVTHKNLAKP